LLTLVERKTQLAKITKLRRATARATQKAAVLRLLLVNGGATIKSMSAAFMADVERPWRKHGAKVLDVLAEKYPQAFFGGMVAMTKVIRWETATDAGGSIAR
jgi:hypothetical protein